MKVLFFGLDYHTYTKDIISEMKNLGATVKYIDIQPRSIGFKVFRTLGRTLYDRYLTVHHAAAIRDSKSIVYDKVVFLQAHQMSLSNLAELRSIQSKAEFTLYNWDALTNHDYRPQAPFFDRVLTFDRRDASEHGYGYLPLFCSRALQGLSRDRVQPNTLFMVGNIVKQERYGAIEKFRSYCDEQGLKFLQHLKISPVVWFQMIRSDFRPIGLSLRSINQDAFRNMVETSCAAFDFANHAQSGQTMRMIESICAGKKVVTNNTWVVKEPFFSPDRVHVFNGLDFSGVADFLSRPIDDPNMEFSDYSIQSFTRQFLGLDELISPGTEK